jgi:hypothetical protein
VEQALLVPEPVPLFLNLFGIVLLVHVHRLGTVR